MAAKRKTKAAQKRRNSTKIDPKWQRFHELFAQLPFTSKDKERQDNHWWALPTTGRYVGGNDVGFAAATAYMKFLRELPEGIGVGGTLQRIALAMLENSKNKKDQSALQGQIVGFFSTLDHYLRQAAQLDSGLDYLL